MPQIDVTTAEDMTKAIGIFLETAPPFERVKLAAFFEGFTKAQDEALKEEEAEHDNSGGS